MSEFYALRRTSIKDVTGFLAFVLGFFGSAPLAWPYLTREAENGDFARGVAVFLAVIAIGAMISGAGGLLLGNGIGWVWERTHRSRRSRASFVRGDEAPDPAPAASDASIASRPTRRRPIPHELAGRTLDAFTVREDGLELLFGELTVRAPRDETAAGGGQARRRIELDVLHAQLGKRVLEVYGGERSLDLLFEGGATIRGLPLPDTAPTESAPSD